MKHIIKKQVIDLLLDNRLDVFAVQQKASMLYYDEILPVLEKTFDSLSNEDQMISIDRLEIDLGRLMEAELHQRYHIDQLLAAIAAQVCDKIKVQPTRDPLNRLEPSSLSVFRQWLFYMHKGYLPWNARVPDADWYNSVLEAGAVDYASMEMLRKLIIEDSRALDRIIYQHDNVFLSHIIELLTAQNHSSLIKVITEIIESIEFLAAKRSASPFFQKKNLIRSIWKEFLQLSSTGTTIKGFSSLLIAENVIRGSFAESQISMIANSGSLLKKLECTRSIWKKLSQEAVQKPKLRLSDTVKAIVPGLESANEDLALSDKQIIKEREERITSLKNITQPDITTIHTTVKEVKDTLKNIESDISEEGIFLPLAGIVLLNPFIHSFFKTLKLVESGNFINESGREKAILLLHWLATGRQEVSEHELVLPKLLCGYLLQEPVDTSLVLNNDEIKEAEELLLAVIGQWEILKNTSPAGLREGFLQRNGKLSFKADHHYLQVEASSIDVLMDHLPWNIGFIKLPWMEQMIKVEWRL